MNGGKKPNDNNSSFDFDFCRNTMGGYNNGGMNSNVYLCSENDAAGVVGKSNIFVMSDF